MTRTLEGTIEPDDLEARCFPRLPRSPPGDRVCLTY